MKKKKIRNEIFKVSAYVAWKTCFWYLAGIIAFLYALFLLFTRTGLERFLPAETVISFSFTFLGGMVLILYLWIWALIMDMNLPDECTGEIHVCLENGMLKARGKTYRECPFARIVGVQKRKHSIVVEYRVGLPGHLFFIFPDAIFSEKEQSEELLSRLKAKASDTVPVEEPIHEVAFPVGDREFSQFSAHLREYAKEANRERNSWFHILYRILLLIILVWYLWPYVLIVPVLLIPGCFLVMWYLTTKYQAFHKYSGIFHRLSAYRPLMGEWVVRAYEDRLRVTRNGIEGWCEWKRFTKIEDTQDGVCFCLERGLVWLEIPKSYMEEAEYQVLVAFCREKAKESSGTPALEPAARRKENAILVLVLAVAVFCLVFNKRNGTVHFPAPPDFESAGLYESAGDYDGSAGDYDGSAGDYEYSEDYVFRPSDYPDYLPLDRQIEILDGLGLEVTKDLEESVREWLDDEWGKIYVEGYPFYSLLMYMGMPSYDSETWEVISYPTEAYWFDFEGWDISTDYLTVLEGVQALSGGEFSFADMEEDCSDMNWEEGTGVIRVKFTCNHNPYEYTAKVQFDWLDEGFLPFLGDVLEKERCQKHLYVCSDNGQGAILFYRDEEWAKNFRKQTGIELVDAGK